MKLSILSSLPLLAFPLAAIAAPSPNMAGLVGWAADKLVSDGEMRTMDSWRYVDCGESAAITFDDVIWFAYIRIVLRF
jgi:hypothetical protein